MANNTNWLNISSQSGSSGQTILTLSANRNYSTNSKRAEITAYNPVYNVSAKTYVSIEAYSPTLSLSPSIVGIPASGGTYELHISANCGWVIAFPDMVTSYSTSASSGDAVVTFTVPNTICATTLVGNIVITDESGQVSRTCRVEQYGEGAHISVSPTAVTLPYYGGSEVFTVTADCVYSVEKGSGQWYSLSSNSGYTGSTQFTVSGASTNSGNTDWTDSITIVGPDGTAATISVTQLNWGQYHFNYTADTSTIAFTGETRTITIDTTDAINSSITIEIIDAPDVTYTYSASGLTRGIVTLNVPQNPGQERNFKVVVRGRRAMSQNYSTAIVEYTQEALRLNFTTDTSNVKGIGETRTITILNTNINPARTGLDLPSDFPQQGAYTVDGNVIYLTYPSNPSSSSTRSWTIRVVAQTYDGEFLDGTYQITQNANVTYQIPYTADTTMVASSGEMRTITIDTSNLVASSITIGVEGATGITYSYDNGVITVVFPNNNGGERNITININGETLNGNYANASVSYTQENGILLKYIVTYDVVQTTGNTKICNNTTSFSSIEYPEGTEIPLSRNYQFPSTGEQTVYFYSKTTSLSDSAFSGCNRMIRVVVPEGVTDIGKSAFAAYYASSGYTNLTAVTLPSTLTGIGASAFARCGFLTGITIPSGVTTIPSGCFEGCSNLTQCDIRSNIITDFGDSAFNSCYNLSSIAIPNTVSGFGNSCFEGCYALSSITIPSNLISFGSNCFERCSRLSSPIIIPSGVSAIPNRCFYSCSSIDNITFPASIQNIGNDAFTECSGITGMTFDGLVPPTINTGNSLGSTAYTYPIYVPCQSVEDYKSAFGSYAPRILCPSSNVTAITLNVPSYIVGSYSATVSYEPQSAQTSLTFSSDLPNVSVGANGVITVSAISPGGGVATICVKDNFTQLQDCKTVTAYSSASSILLSQSPYGGGIDASGETGYVTVLNNYGFQPGTIGFSVSGDGATYVQNDNRLDITFPGNKFGKRKEYSITASGLSWDGNVYTKTVSFNQEGKTFTGGTIAATYYVTSTTIPTRIMEDTSYVTRAEYPQGTEITFDTGYTFPTTGLQTVFFTITGGTVDGFGGCSDLVSITLPDDIECIGDFAFDACTSLSAVNINSGSSLLFVYGGSFSDCSSLHSFTFPKDFYQLGGSINEGSGIGQYSHPFRECPITSFTSYAIVEPILYLSFSSSGLRPFGTLFYPCGSDYSTWLSDENNLGYRRWYDTCFVPGQPIPAPYIPTGQDLEVFVTYNITQTTGDTKILENTRSFISAELVDGSVPIPLATDYTFPSTGMQTVKYTMSNETFSVGGFKGVEMDNIVFPTCTYKLDDSAFENAKVSEMTFYAVKAPHFTIRALHPQSGSDSGTFKFISTNGVLRYPAGSDYSLYLDTTSYPNGYTLGTFGWTGTEIE